MVVVSCIRDKGFFGFFGWLLLRFSMSPMQCNLCCRHATLSVALSALIASIPGGAQTDDEISHMCAASVW
jgi:hypothetical protein